MHNAHNSNILSITLLDVSDCRKWKVAVLLYNSDDMYFSLHLCFIFFIYKFGNRRQIIGQRTSSIKFEQA